MIATPNVKTLIQLQQRKHDVVLALLANIKDWLPQANSVQEAVDLLGLDPDDYFQDEEDATADAIEIQQKWIAYHVNEQATAIMGNMYSWTETIIMDHDNAE